MVDCDAEPPVECDGDDLVSAQTLCDDVFKRGRRLDVSFHYFKCCQMFSGFPFGLETLEKWEGIFQSGESQGILNRLEKSGKITQNFRKMRKFQINIIL